MDDSQSESMEVDPSEVNAQNSSEGEKSTSEGEKSTSEGEKKACDGEKNASDGEKASEGEKSTTEGEKSTTEGEKNSIKGKDDVSEGGNTTNEGEKDSNISKDDDGPNDENEGASEPKTASSENDPKSCEMEDAVGIEKNDSSAGSGNKEELENEGVRGEDGEESMEVENNEKVSDDEEDTHDKSGDLPGGGSSGAAERKDEDGSSEGMDVSADDSKKQGGDESAVDTDVTNREECSGEEKDGTNNTKDDSIRGSVSDDANDNARDTETPMDCDDPKSSSKTAEDGASEVDKDDKKEEEKAKEDDSAGTSIKEKDEGSDIEEIPVQKKPAEVVDLEEEEEEVGKKEEEGSTEKETDDDKKDDKKDDSDSNSKGLKLRSLASLVDTSENESPDGEEKREPTPLKSGALVPNPEAFGAIGEIVEHKDMFFDPESGGLPLRIASVVGGEDCITGLAMDDDRDMLSAIQISSVTTLIDPISPEDPNKDKDKDGSADADQEVDAEKADSANLESSEESGIKIVSAESLASKEDENEKSQDTSSGPKIRLSSAVSEVAKDDAVKDTSATPSVVYHILRSILTMPRSCNVCLKTIKCEFRITKKGHHGTFAFLCSTECRTKFTNNLKTSEVIEKPRLIFEKLCGMCHKDLTSQPRSGQFSWETREFCSELCLTSHLEQVASKCHTCNITVRPMYIGKYCVRFGSDIHQFCSNHCLERYKTKIKVCCYCQKNVENVLKVTSPANKEYCSLKCLKRAQRRDIGQQNYNETHPCTVCQTQGSNRYEFLVTGEAQQLCSDPCLNVFKYVNKVKAVTCCLCFRVMNAEDVCHYLYHDGHQLRVFCSDSCVNVFILSARKIVVCDTCKVKKYNFDMIHRQVDEDFREYYYCSLHCLKIRDNNSSSEKTSTTTSTTTTATTTGTIASGNISSSSSNEAPIAVCSMCNNLAKAQFHMVMSDNTLRSFCRYSCASRYKNTFGFLVDSPQSKEASQTKNASVSTIRSKPTSQLTTTSTSTTTSPANKSVTPGLSQEALQATTELLKMLVPPTVANKTTMCKPSTCTKGVYCKPHPWHRQTQTEMAGIDSNMSNKDYPPILPVPIPCYVPAPMCMYNAPCPVPIFVPIPLPVPIFLPTTAKTSKDVMAMMKKIQEEIPSDPIQAEMLLLARQSMEEGKDEGGSEEDATEQADEVASPTDNFTSYSGDDEAGNDEVINDELNSADEACLNTMEEDLPRYPLRDTEITSNYSETETVNENKGKRKKRSRGRPRKRARHDSDESQSMSDVEDADDPEFLPEPETVLEEEFQGPFLNQKRMAVRSQIVALRKKGLTVRAIGQQLGISTSTVTRWTRRWETSKELKDLGRAHRPRITTPEDDANILQMIRDTKETNAIAIRNNLNLNISARTIQRRVNELCKREDIPMSKKSKQLPTVDNFAARLEFARQYVDKGTEFWDRVVFTDEKVFSVTNQGNIRLWRRSDTRYDEEYISDEEEQSNSSATCIVFGWMCSFGAGDITQIEGRMTPQRYVDILENFFLPSFRKKNFPFAGPVVFAHDKSSLPADEVVQQWFMKQEKKFEQVYWPRNGAIMSPIENMWNNIANSWQTNRDGTSDEVFVHTKMEWERFRYKAHIMRHIVSTIPDRLKEIVKVEGGWKK